MHPDVEAFRDALEAKRAVKEQVMVALGAAKYAEHEAEVGEAHGDADAAKYRERAAEQWDIVSAKGMAGEEGRLFAEAQAIADRYVAEHPEQFEDVREAIKAHPKPIEAVTTLATAIRRAGFEEAALRLQMFELHTFERQQIGGEVQARYRTVGKVA